MNGILIIDKPEGITSHDVVARCRRILRTRRVGHTGTLDPFATGVMVVLVEKATRLAQFLDRDAKEYEAIVRLGFETDTGDRTGAPREGAMPDLKAEISKAEINRVLNEFRGEIRQTPPMYSAKKIEGKKLYELARQGVEIERRPQRVTIYELELIGVEKEVQDEAESRAENARKAIFEAERLGKEYPAANSAPKDQNAPTGQQESGAARKATDPQSQIPNPKSTNVQDFAVRVACSAGTYIRVLAEDIGRRLGTGAHLAELRRTRAGRFDISRAVTLEQLEQITSGGALDQVLISMNEAVSHLAEISLSEEEALRIKNGMKLKRDVPAARDGEAIRLTDRADLLAIGIYSDAEKIVRPKLVFM